MKKRIIDISLEVLPIIFFFFGSKFFDIFVATALLMVSSIICILVYYYLNKSIAIVSLASCFLAIIFGTLTLVFQNPDLIKIKITILNIVIALIFFASGLLKKNFMKSFSDEFDSKNPILVYSWGLLFFGIAIINEFVWRNFSTNAWINFKVFGTTSIVIIFTIIQVSITYIYKNYILKDSANNLKD